MKNIFGNLFNKSKAEGSPSEIIMKACIEGKAVELSTVSDEAFAAQMMGKGIGIVPKKGFLYAPVTGEATAVFETGHAVGITTKEGVEILLHIGVNTVELKGRGFVKKVSEGQQVSAGDVLVEFDIDEIVKAGYDPVTMMVISNSDEFPNTEVISLGDVTKDADVLSVKIK
ncbi:MAG: PTS sugar transporter subunit IIA [Treponemataceae bacterium]